MRVTVVAKVKNAVLWTLVEKAGSQSALAEYLGISPVTLGGWLNFQHIPNFEHDSDRWKTVEDKLLLLGGVGWSDIFPPESRYVYGRIPRHFIRETEIEPEALLRATTPGALPSSLDRIDLPDAVSIALAVLSRRELQVIQKRFGLDGHGEMTLAEVGAELGVCGQRVREIEAKALRKLRHPRTAALLRPFIE